MYTTATLLSLRSAAPPLSPQAMAGIRLAMQRASPSAKRRGNARRKRNNKRASQLSQEGTASNAAAAGVGVLAAAGAGPQQPGDAVGAAAAPKAKETAGPQRCEDAAGNPAAPAADNETAGQAQPMASPALQSAKRAGDAEGSTPAKKAKGGDDAQV